MKRGHLLAFVLTMAFAPLAWPFCGFYVAKADTKLFNRASQVVIARAEDRTVLTMANDFQGEPREFAVVIPVPTFIGRDQIHVGDKAHIDHLDAYTAPRLVEYFDPDPCRVMMLMERSAAAPASAPPSADAAAKSLGVTIEARYTVGEYDILILSAEQSDGLETWLTDNGYQLPAGASRVLGSYIRQGMRFFVARVNLAEQAKLGFSYLRPLQVAYESPKFMLPIRLGTLNADGPQELFVYTLTPKGRVETVNYRTVRLPTGMDIPIFVREEFGDFYRALFDEQVRREQMRAVFLEYAWDMNWCDPCAADPLSSEELEALGVHWLDDGRPGVVPMPRPVPPGRLVPPQPQPRNVFVTRLHLRYTADTFPDDLVFQETGDRTNFQGRYVLRHPWTGKADCDGARQYRAALPARLEHEAQTLANLTGWDIATVREKIGPDRLRQPAPQPGPWWRKIWPDAGPR
ncbi:MAG: DUF2330 domain-containing protein [Ectothiorhodospiraceae bacterium]|nr:DUF2330 domain-containing protein [Ectothiorhodospiraceae bacterium]